MESGPHPLSPLLERMTKFRASPSPFWNRRTKSPKRRAELESIDRDVMVHMQSQGFLDLLPQSGDIDLHSPIADCVSYTVPGHAGSLWMKSDHMGRVGKVASAPGAHSSDPETWVRWLFLLHEAAHCQFAHESVRFAPTPGRLDPSAVSALNDWRFGPLAHTGQPMAVVLNECFADTYAAMMLLQASGHCAEAHQAIADVLRFRIQARQDCESTYAQSSEMSDRQTFLGTHHTDGALENMLGHLHDWKDLSPDQLKQRALQYASDALLDWASPDRPQALGGTQGDRVWKQIAPEKLPLMPALTTMVSIHLAGQDAPGYVRQSHAHHPSSQALLDLWEELVPQIEAIPSHIKAPLVEGLQHYTPEVDHAIAQFTQTCVQPCSATLPSIEAAEVQFTQARELIQAALQAAAPADVPALTSWRKARPASPSSSGPPSGLKL